MSNTGDTSPSTPDTNRKNLKDIVGDFLKKFKGLNSKAFSLIQNNSITTRNLVVSAATYGLDRLLNAKAFNCPEERHELYGYTFLFAPVIILFCINVLVIGEVWKLSSRMCVKRYKRHGDCVARVVPSLLKACVGPAVWLIVTFLEEDYYLCAILGPVPRKGNATLTSEQEDVEWRHKVEECKSLSHIWAWTVLVALVILGSAVVIWRKCFLKDNLLMYNHCAYERREALSAMKAFSEHMCGAGAEFKYKDADLDNNPGTAEYGGEEENIKLYKDGIPEKIGRETVKKLFEGSEGWKYKDKWHYIKVFAAFREMYPRITTGRPFDPWRAVQGDENGNQGICLLSSGKNEMELEPLYSEPGSSLVCDDLTDVIEIVTTDNQGPQGKVSTEDQLARKNSGHRAQRNSGHRGTVGTEEQCAQRNSGHRGTVGTEEQWAWRNSGHVLNDVSQVVVHEP